MRNAAIDANRASRSSVSSVSISFVSHAYALQAHQSAASTRIPSPRPAHVGSSDISTVTWVRVKTKTRSKNSSSGVARSSTVAGDALGPAEVNPARLGASPQSCSRR